MYFGLLVRLKNATQLFSHTRRKINGAWLHFALRRLFSHYNSICFFSVTFFILFFTFGLGMFLFFIWAFISVAIFAPVPVFNSGTFLWVCHFHTLSISLNPFQRLKKPWKNSLESLALELKMKEKEITVSSVCSFFCSRFRVLVRRSIENGAKVNAFNKWAKMAYKVVFIMI